MVIRTYVVDAFTDKEFRGNPAAVCMLDYMINGTEMQKIAAEMRHSETAFVRRIVGGVGGQYGTEFAIRWFTPTTEVDLCAHATLAAAAALFDAGVVAPTVEKLRFKAEKTGISFKVTRIAPPKDNPTALPSYILTFPAFPDLLKVDEVALAQVMWRIAFAADSLKHPLLGGKSLEECHPGRPPTGFYLSKATKKLFVVWDKDSATDGKESMADRLANLTVTPEMMRDMMKSTEAALNPQARNLAGLAGVSQSAKKESKRKSKGGEDASPASPGGLPPTASMSSSAASSALTAESTWDGGPVTTVMPDFAAAPPEKPETTSPSKEPPKKSATFLPAELSAAPSIGGKPLVHTLKDTDLAKWVKGVCFTVATGEKQFVSRYFSPWNGIGEDPVNGSSHTVLAPLWTQRLGVKRGTHLDARVVSERGGKMVVAWEKSDEKPKVSIECQAVVVLRGELMTH